jgi:predicted DNA-binding antitoxin AbrB/MazE fold protein
MDTEYIHRVPIIEVFDFGGLKPKKKVVELHDGCCVTVPVIDFEEAARSLLDDETVMNNIMEEFEAETWRPKTSAAFHENDPSAIIGDKDSGYMYRQGITLHCLDESDGIDPAYLSDHYLF